MDSLIILIGLGCSYPIVCMLSMPYGSEFSSQFTHKIFKYRLQYLIFRNGSRTTAEIETKVLNYPISHSCSHLQNTPPNTTEYTSFSYVHGAVYIVNSMVDRRARHDECERITIIQNIICNNHKLEIIHEMKFEKNHKCVKIELHILHNESKKKPQRKLEDKDE